MRCVPFSVVVLLAACGGSDINQPTAGSVMVTAATTGDRPDADGYAVVLDGGAGRALGIGGTVTFSEVVVGDHALLLEGIAPNCAVDGDNPVGLVVSAGSTEEVVFAIACSAELARLEVSTVTTGASPDPDGYLVSVDGAAEITLGIRDSIVITGLSTGAHQVRLGGVAANCTIAGANPRSVTIQPEELGRVEFVVVCAPPTPATLVVTLSTQVINWPGFSGRFAIVVDGGQEQPIPTNGSIIISPLQAGVRSVLLKHPQSCGVGGFTGDSTNPKTVTLTSGRTAAVRFTVLCIG